MHTKKTIAEERGLKFLPEWVAQDAVLLVWPTEYMDWRHNYEAAVNCYTQITTTLLHYVNVVVVTDTIARLQHLLRQTHPHQLVVVDGFRQNDTWVRDFGPISMAGPKGEKVIFDFGFNAWGLKFAAATDNLFTHRLFHTTNLFHPSVEYASQRGYILEGGAIETNEEQVLLSTESVLSEPNRNPSGTYESHIKEVAHRLNCPEYYSLNIAPMEGDDTDGHIDTIARFTTSGAILFNYTEENTDVHFLRLQQLRTELERTGKKLVPLPLPTPIYNKEGEQLPATYANFLVTNGVVVVPIYADANDEVALSIIQQNFPERAVVGVDCRALIEQGGSLHCITMQIPKGFLNL